MRGAKSGRHNPVSRRRLFFQNLLASFAIIGLQVPQSLWFQSTISTAYAHGDGAKHSLIKPNPTSESITAREGVIHQDIRPMRRTPHSKTEKKPRRSAQKETPSSTRQSGQASTTTGPLSSQRVGDSPHANTSTREAPVSTLSSKSSMPGTSMTPMSGVSTVAPMVTSGSTNTATGAMAESTGSSTSGIQLNGPSKPSGGRTLNNIIQQVPGLANLAAGLPLPPVIPVEPLAPLPPPLAAPQPGLPALPPNWFAYHVVNRVTYGGTPNQLNHVASLRTTADAQAWATSYLKEQLELDPGSPWPTNLHNTTPLPAPIPTQDIATDIMLSQDKGDWRADDSDASVLSPSFSQLQDHDLIRKMHSRRQLKEKMVYFWDNHFNTNYRTHSKGQYELQENETFRRLAFGRFLDLLTASGKSAAMMIYLNTDVNVKENPNENYAREVLELHTLGVDANGNPNGYTQFDIVEAAKAFTGWDNTPDVRGGFRFVASRHSPGSKLFLGQSIPFNGSDPSEGEQVLTLAARHPSTARHLAKKLCEYFVSDSPSNALITEVASVFADSDGDIKKVLIAIFTSSEFANPANYRGQVKTPLEYIVGIYRNLGVWSSRDPFRTRLVNIGQSIYEFPPPTGFKEKSIEWLNTNVLFHEASLAYESTIAGFGSSIKYGSTSSGGLIRNWMVELNLTTEEQILGLLTNLTVDRVVTATEYQLYLSTMRAGLGGATFDIRQSSREEALDRTMATILTNPRYLYQ